MPVLSDAPFFLPFDGSLIPQNGSGIGTFTRATGQRVFDNEDKLITLPSGAVAMEGYRVIVNRLPSSTDFTVFVEAVSGLGSITNRTANYALDPDGNMLAYRVSLSLGGGTATTDIARIFYSGGVGVNRSATIPLYLKTNDGSTKIVLLWWGSSKQTLTVTGTWTRFEFTSSSATDTTMYLGLRGGQTPASSDSVDLLIAKAMLLDTTGQADKSGVEFVSKGVLPPPYYGGGADGLLYSPYEKDGTLIPASKRKGVKLRSSAVTNTLLYCRDFTNAAWAKTNVTAALTQTGIDGQANACSLLTASSANGTALQSITAAASAGCTGFYIKRSVGTGSVYITRDGGSNWPDITSLINSSAFTLCKVENTSVLNPQVGIKIATPGDAVIVDYGINHLGTEIASPILTTSAAVTVNAETLTYPTAGNFSDTAGTIIATVERGNWANNNGVVVGKAGSGLATSASNSGVQALDGTNTVNGPAGSTATRRKIGMKWSGSAMKTFAGGNFGAPGSYDGSFNLTTIAIMPQANGYIRDVAIWPTELSDADMLAVASEQSDFSAALSFAYSAYANVIHSVSAAMPLSFDVTGYTSVIHSVSSDMDIDFNAAIQANVIHSVSADMGIIFDVDFDSTWIIPSLKIDGSYDPPVIQGTYGPTT